MRPVPGTWEVGEPPMPMQWRKDEAAPIVAGLEAEGSTLVKVYDMGECRIILAREPAGVHGEMLWHLTISCPNRHPIWDEIKAARYWLLPDDICVGMLLPPPQFYVNLEQQDHVMQLWEVTDPRSPWTGP